MGANVLVKFKIVFFNWGQFFTIGGIFFQLGAKNYFGIQKINYFGNYIDPCAMIITINIFLEIESIGLADFKTCFNPI